MISPEAQKVQEALIARGLETPLVPSEMTADEKYQRIRGLLTEVISTLGLDLTDDSLAETPHRISKCTCMRFSLVWITRTFQKSV